MFIFKYTIKFHNNNINFQCTKLNIKAENLFNQKKFWNCSGSGVFNFAVLYEGGLKISKSMQLLLGRQSIFFMGNMIYFSNILLNLFFIVKTYLK